MLPALTSRIPRASLWSLRGQSSSEVGPAVARVTGARPGSLAKDIHTGSMYVARKLLRDQDFLVYTSRQSWTPCRRYTCRKHARRAQALAMVNLGATEQDQDALENTLTKKRLHYFRAIQLELPTPRDNERIAEATTSRNIPRAPVAWRSPEGRDSAFFPLSRHMHSVLEATRSTRTVRLVTTSARQLVALQPSLVSHGDFPPILYSTANR